MCLPGVEIVPGPCGSILHATRASQLPHSDIFIFCDFQCFLDISPFHPFNGPYRPWGPSVKFAMDGGMLAL